MIYALVWKSTGTRDEFESRIPLLLEWLRDLRESGRLCACGEWDDDAGALTVVDVPGLADAQELVARYPLDEIGETKIHRWDVLFADLHLAHDW